MSAPRSWFDDDEDYELYLQAHGLPHKPALSFAERLKKGNVVPVVRQKRTYRKKSRPRRRKVPYAVKRIQWRRQKELWQKHPMYRQLPFRFFKFSSLK